MDDQTLALAERVWAYHHLHHQPRPADVMVVLGTNDTRVAEFAARLYSQGFAPRVAVTGGIAHQGDLLATSWNEPEADVFARVLMAHGVPETALVLERAATNTAENIRFTKCLIADPAPASVLYVCKPFMPRRVYATHVVEWPEMPAAVASWESTFADYCNDALPHEKILNIMLGDLQRLWIYAQRGYSAPQRVPAEVMDAYRELLARGYDRHQIAG